MGITAEHVKSVNRCQIAEMEKLGKALDPKEPRSCEMFAVQVRNVQAAVIHTIFHFQAVLHSLDKK